MLSRAWLLTVMMTMMKSDASAKLITVARGNSVVLPAGPQTRLGGNQWEVRWTHRHLLLNKKTTRCHHGRCELQPDGSLSFSRVLLEDAGNYTLQVFHENGTVRERKTFLLQVTDTSGGHGGASVLVSCLVLLFLLLVSIIIFILRRRRMQTTMTSGQTEENIYMPMHSHHGNEAKPKEEERKEEENHYVPLHPAAPKEHEEDVYV